MRDQEPLKPLEDGQPCFPPESAPAKTLGTPDTGETAVTRGQ